MDHNAIVAECLDQLGLSATSKNISLYTDGEELQEYIDLAESVAIKRNDQDVLQRLYFAGLIYNC